MPPWVFSLLLFLKIDLGQKVGEQAFKFQSLSESLFPQFKRKFRKDRHELHTVNLKARTPWN